MKLYELSEQYAQALNELEHLDDEQLIQDTLEGLQGDIQDKCLNTIMYAKNINVYIDGLDAEIKRMSARKKSLQNQVKRTHKYVLENMQRSGISEIKCDAFVIKINKGRESTVITDESKVPEIYKEEVTSIKIDKMAIRKAGGCAGASIVRTPTLSIK